uniref:JAB1/MPN/MOV34 metalloenzyme domain-containing protein n=1 Tax=Oryza meridionalis TaxID=40149 RepID=A0A0E0E770_9ORYZ
MAAAAAAAADAPFLGPDSPVHDTSQTAYVSPLALLKILVHAARDSPVAAMGVILREEVDGFSVRVVDAFPLPRCAGGGAFTQAIDPRYIEGMLAMLNKTDSKIVDSCVRVMFSHQVFDQLTKRLHGTILGDALSMVRCKLTCSLGENAQPVSSAKGLYLSWISFHISLMWFEGVVGWYRSNPGFYGRPSNHDAVFHKAFEQLNPRAILVAVDPVKSATGNFTMNAFRSVTSYHEASSNVGALNREYYSVAEDEKPFFELDIFAQGLASVFYSILISHRKNDLEINILKSMDKMGSKGSSSEDCRSLCQFPVMSESEKKNVEEMLIDLLTKYQNEEEMQESDAPENPPDAENHLEELKNLMSACILQIFGMMLAWSSF